MALVPQVVQAVGIPVIAAGGIGDGRGMVAAFALGAQGIQMGTAFLTVSECPIHEHYQQDILQAEDTSTTVIQKSSGGAIRGVKNQLTASKDEKTFNLSALQRAADDGEIQKGIVMSGQIVGLLQRVQPTKEFLAEIYADAASVLQSRKID